VNRSTNPLGLVSLLVVLVGVGLFMAWQYGGLGRDDVTATEGPVDTSAPPRDVASNPRAARRFVEASVCNSDCVSADRVCRGVASDTRETAACAEELETCQGACNAAPHGR